MQDNAEQKRGWLNQGYRFVHLKDNRAEQFGFHYHEFHKVIFFISGQVTYFVEGMTHRLQPGDVLLVSNRDIHRAQISRDVPYERQVVWINPRYIAQTALPESSLGRCFQAGTDMRRHLCLTPLEQETLRLPLQEMDASMRDEGYGAGLIRDARFHILMTTLNRIFLEQDNRDLLTEQHVSLDNALLDILRHIHADPGAQLDVRTLAERAYMSPYTLMHRFREQTGFTVHGYVQQKRLLLAGTLLKEGIPAMSVAQQCGFQDYSSFSRAFRKLYGNAPSQFTKNT